MMSNNGMVKSRVLDLKKIVAATEVCILHEKEKEKKKKTLFLMSRAGGVRGTFDEEADSYGNGSLVSRS